jgi:hypothetical protein
MRQLPSYQNFVNEARLYESKYQKINIFDVDDTLVVTDSKIKVTDNKTGKVFELTPKEFNEYRAKPHHDLDFSDFSDPDILKAGKIIDWVFEILKGTMKKGKRVGIITARGDAQLIYDFLIHHGVDVNPKYIFAINDPKQEFEGDSISKRKIEAFQRLIDMGFHDFTFFDDDRENIRLAQELDKQNPDIKLKTRLIKQKWIPKL